MDPKVAEAWRQVPTAEEHAAQWSFSILIPPPPSKVVVPSPEQRSRSRKGQPIVLSGSEEDEEEEDELDELNAIIEGRLSQRSAGRDGASPPSSSGAPSRSAPIASSTTQGNETRAKASVTGQAKAGKKQDQSLLFRASDDEDHGSSEPDQPSAIPSRSTLTAEDRNAAGSSKQPAPPTAQERAKAAADLIRKQRREAEEAEAEARKAEREQKRKKKKRKLKEQMAAQARKKMSGNSSDEAGRGDDDDDDDISNLRSNLNADAFVRATAPRARKDFQSSLQKLKKARKGKNRQAGIKDSDDEGNASSSSSSSSSSSASSSSDAFIVSDDSMDNKRARQDIRAVDGRRDGPRQPQHARRSGPSGSSKPKQRQGLALADSSGSLLHRRMDLDEAAYEFLAWCVCLLLQLPIESEDEAVMDRARNRLAEHVDDSIRLMSTQSMRRQFQWYLRRYPLLRRETMSRTEANANRGCAACHRAKQVCDSRIILSGRAYQRDTLEWLSYREDVADSSEASTSEEDRAEHQHPTDPSRTFTRRMPPPPKRPEGEEEEDEREQEEEDEERQRRAAQRLHVFNCGSWCAERAEHMHKMLHFQYDQLNRVHTSREFKALKEKRARQGDGAITAEDIGRIARQRKEHVKSTLNHFRSVATRLARAK